MSNRTADDEAGGSEPASPMSQYMNNSVLSISVLGVLEFEVPLDDLESQIIPLLSNVFLPISPRFSSIMVWSSRLHNERIIGLSCCVLSSLYSSYRNHLKPSLLRNLKLQDHDKEDFIYISFMCQSSLYI